MIPLHPHPFARAWAGMLVEAAFAATARKFFLPRGPLQADWEKPTAGGKRYGNPSGQRYPEQSARQQLRGLRRAQGGPGITEGANPKPRIQVDANGNMAWGNAAGNEIPNFGARA